MAEALAIVSLISSIVQFVDFSSKIVHRLNEFHSSLDEVPKSFRDVKIELPLLVDTLGSVHRVPFMAIAEGAIISAPSG